MAEVPESYIACVGAYVRIGVRVVRGEHEGGGGGTRPPSASSRVMVDSSTLSVVSVVLSIVLLSTCAGRATPSLPGGAHTASARQDAIDAAL